MNDILFTTNLTKTVTDELQATEIVDRVELQTYAGQQDQSHIRIGNSLDEPLELLVYSTDTNLTLSLNDTRGFAPAVHYPLAPLQVGSTIFLRLTCPLDPTEGDREGSIVVADSSGTVSGILKVSYFLASIHEGDTETSAFSRFLGSETLNVLQQFEDVGEAVKVTRFDPVSKPEFTQNAIRNDLFASLSDPAEWCNPNNAIAGYAKRSAIATRAFVGDEELSVDTLYDYANTTVNESDVSRLLLPPDFLGCDPKPVSVPIPFGQGSTSQTPVYQRTQWTMKRNNAEYALLNIRKQSYFKGQFLYWIADLVRIQYPGADNSFGFLPWNQLYDASGRLVQYVKSWSTVIRENPYDPYLEPQQGGST